MKSGRQSGFTLVELMVVVAIIGILASVAVPAFMRYIKKAKTAEARELVRKIYDGARSYYLDPAAGGTSIGEATVPSMFPEPSQTATPALGTCCATGGRCLPSTAYWSNPTWGALAFSVDDPAYFMYAYKVEGNAAVGAMAPVDGSNNFTAIAYGDLDCNGVYSTFTMFGVVNSVYADGPAGSAALGRSKELE